MVNCSCKRAFCPHCSLCTACGCICNGPKRKRGRPSSRIVRRVSPRKGASSTPVPTMSNRRPPLQPSERHSRSSPAVLTGPSHLLSLLELPSSLSKHLPGKHALQTKKWNDFSQKERNYICKFMTTVTNGIAARIAPLCVDELVDALQTEGSGFTEAIIDGIKASKLGSVERRVLRGLLATVKPGQVMYDLLKEDKTSTPTSMMEANATVSGTLTNPVGKLVPSSSSQNGSSGSAAVSIQLSSDLQHALTNEDVSFLHHVEGSLDNSVNETTKERRLAGSFRKRYAGSRKDWNDLMASGSLLKRPKGRTMRDDTEIKFALRFILSSDNVQFLSWGTKTILMPDGERKDFPGVCRKRDPEEIYRSYEYTVSQPDCTEKPLSRSVFLRLVLLATKRQQHRKSAVDYVLGTLCYDTMNLLREITSDLVPTGTEKQELLLQLDATEEFLKFSYMEHVGRTQDGFHDVEHALNLSSTASGLVECKECLSPFAILQKLETHSHISGHREDAVTAIKECRNKFLLFMGHQVRVSVQKKKILEVQSLIESDESGKRVLLLMDFKMKFEPIMYREKTVDFFGKRGLSWHGVVAFYRNNAGEMAHLYIDQIVGNNSKQDTTAVISLFDAALARVKKELVNTREVYVLSDNARCYQNHLLPVMIPFITKSHGLQPVMFLHSETQDGKSLVDAHFAVAMMHVCKYVDDGHSVKTPSQLVNAINSNGGVANTVADLVFIDRVFSKLVRWVNSKNIAKLPRLNEIQYIQETFDPDPNVGFKAIVYRMSGMMSTTYSLNLYESTLIRNSSSNDSAVPHGRTEPNHANSEDGDDNDNFVPELEVDSNMIENGAMFGADRPEFLVESARNSQPTWYRSSETGCSIRTEASIRYLTHRAALRMRRIRSRRAQMPISEIQLAINEQEDVAQAEENDCTFVQENCTELNMPTCQKCGGRFSSENNLLVHTHSCKGSKPTTIIDRAKLQLFEMLSARDFPIYSSLDTNPSFQSLTIPISLAMELKRKAGWACRSVYGQTLGLNTAQLFREDIIEFVMRGVEDKSRKMAPSSMREELKRRYPNRYDIPNEQFIIRLVQGELQRLRRSQTQNGGQPRIRARIPQNYADVLKGLVRCDEKLMPRHACQAVIEKMQLNEGHLPEDFPNEQQFASLCSRYRKMSKDGML